MNITDLRKGERRTNARRAEDKSESNLMTDQELEDKRSGQDRRQADRRHFDTHEESSSGESYIRVPINPEIQNLLLDMYSDDQEK